jgi:hypothetical protein
MYYGAPPNFLHTVQELFQQFVSRTVEVDQEYGLLLHLM